MQHTSRQHHPSIRRRHLPHAWALACLALVLLWAQMGGWLHGLSHTLAHTSANTQPPSALAALHRDTTHHLQGEATQGHADQVCQDCLAFAALAFGAPATQALLGDWFGLRHAAPTASTGRAPRPAAFWAYQTRAPPR